MSNSKITTMTFVKSTKNTHVYAEDEIAAFPLVPAVYIKKGELPNPPPEVVKLTVEW